MDGLCLKMLLERHAAQIIDEIELVELMIYINKATAEDLYALSWEQWQCARAASTEVIAFNLKDHPTARRRKTFQPILKLL
jgi:hypothetical protein